MKEYLVSLTQKYPRIESAIVTFIGFFLVDVGTSIQQLGAHGVPVITYAVIWGAIVAAARAALKELWVWYKTPSQS